MTPPSARPQVFSGQDALAGFFFQISLLPYLFFLYFLCQVHNLPPTANLGFQFVLVFVVMTIVSSAVAQTLYQEPEHLANVDWLHGGAETQLTVANLLLVVGLVTVQVNNNNNNNNGTAAATASSSNYYKRALLAALLVLAFCVGLLVYGVAIGYQNQNQHAQYLGGLGNLSLHAVPWARYTEPENALSIATWCIHWSSVYEYLFAMNLIWKFCDRNNNNNTGSTNLAWKGLTWGMLPLHASSICAVTHHFFYNAPSLQFLVTIQGGLTLLGNTTCMIAAFRIAKRDGWTWTQLLSCLCCYRRRRHAPLNNGSSPDSHRLVDDGAAVSPVTHIQSQTRSDDDNDNNNNSRNSHNTTILAIKLVVLTVLTSYTVKYGELGLELPFDANPVAAWAMILGIPAITACQYLILSVWEGRRRRRRSRNDDNKNNNENEQAEEVAENYGLSYAQTGLIADEETPLQQSDRVAVGYGLQ